MPNREVEDKEKLFFTKVPLRVGSAALLGSLAVPMIDIIANTNHPEDPYQGENSGGIVLDDSRLGKGYFRVDPLIESGRGDESWLVADKNGQVLIPKSWENQIRPALNRKSSGRAPVSMIGGAPRFSQESPNCRAETVYAVNQRGTVPNVAQLAFKYGVSVDRILAANGVTAAYQLAKQDTIIIPPSCNSSTSTQVVRESAPVRATDCQDIHIIKKGETLFSIARRCGVALDDLRGCNGLVDSTIFAGQRLVIPPSPKCRLDTRNINAGINNNPTAVNGTEGNQNPDLNFEAPPDSVTAVSKLDGHVIFINPNEVMFEVIGENNGQLEVKFRQANGQWGGESYLVPVGKLPPEAVNSGGKLIDANAGVGENRIIGKNSCSVGEGPKGPKWNVEPTAGPVSVGTPEPPASDTSLPAPDPTSEAVKSRNWERPTTIPATPSAAEIQVGMGSQSGPDSSETGISRPYSGFEVSDRMPTAVATALSGHLAVGQETQRAAITTQLTIHDDLDGISSPWSPEEKEAIGRTVNSTFEIMREALGGEPGQFLDRSLPVTTDGLFRVDLFRFPADQTEEVEDHQWGFYPNWDGKPAISAPESQEEFSGKEISLYLSHELAHPFPWIPGIKDHPEYDRAIGEGWAELVGRLNLEREFGISTHILNTGGGIEVDPGAVLLLSPDEVSRFVPVQQQEYFGIAFVYFYEKGVIKYISEKYCQNYPNGGQPTLGEVTTWGEEALPGFGKLFSDASILRPQGNGGGLSGLAQGISAGSIGPDPTSEVISLTPSIASSQVGVSGDHSWFVTGERMPTAVATALGNSSETGNDASNSWNAIFLVEYEDSRSIETVRQWCGEEAIAPTEKEILEANGLSSWEEVSVGMKLKIPRVWTVEAGNTLDTISETTGVSKAVIAAYNKLYKGFPLPEGARIVIPKKNSEIFRPLEFTNSVTIEGQFSDVQKEAILNSLRMVEESVTAIPDLYHYRDLPLAINTVGNGLELPIYSIDTPELARVSDRAFYAPMGNTENLPWGIYLNPEYIDAELKEQYFPVLGLPHELWHLLQDYWGASFEESDIDGMVSSGMVFYYADWSQ